MTIKRIVRALRAMEDHWVGQLVGTISLFFGFYEWTLILWAFQ